MVGEGYGLIGFPLGHSFSASYFNEKFKAEKIDATYRLFPIESIDELGPLLDRHPEIVGLNVTIPYKRSVMKFLDSLSEDAEAIGAVNVLGIGKDTSGRRTMRGYNSDWLGFMESLVPRVTRGMNKALILGTGGAAKAVAYALRKMNMESTFVSRRKAAEGSEDILTYSELSESVVGSHLLTVNATPVGMWPDIEKAPSFPYEFLTKEHLCYDLIYNPELTGFMKRSAAFGATVVNGLEMLHNQAEIAWRIWQSFQSNPE